MTEMNETPSTWGKVKQGDMRVVGGLRFYCSDPDIDRWVSDGRQEIRTRNVSFCTLYKLWEKLTGRPLIKNSTAHQFAEAIFKEMEPEAEETVAVYGNCAITGPAEDVSFILKNLPDVDDY